MMPANLPSGWIMVPLSKVAVVQTGLALGKTVEADAIRLPYLRVANVQDGFLDLREIKSVEIDRSQISRYSLQVGDVLMTEGGDFDKLGRGCIWNGEIPNCLHQNHIFVVRPHSGLMPYYLASLTSSDYGRRFFQSCSKQSTNLASINSSQLKAFPIPLPPLPEQEAISRVVSVWDRGIRQFNDLIAAKDRFKRVLTHQLLTGKRRFPGFTGEWKHEMIGQYLEECSSRVSTTTELPIYTSSRAGLKPQKEYYGGRTVTNDGEYGVVPSDCFVFRHMSDDGLFVFHLNQTGGDIAVSKEYPVFRAINLDRHFLLGKLNHSPEFKAFALSQKAGGTRTRLYFSKLRTWKTLLPSLFEQRLIAEVLNAADREIYLLRKQLYALTQQKKGLIQKLLTGQVRIKL